MSISYIISSYTRTDDLIQRVIQKCFSHCTVLTIAHRVNTVLNSDRILVLDDGKVKVRAWELKLYSTTHTNTY